MSNAICKSCGSVNLWRAQRGTKLKDRKCGACGGDLEAHNEKKHGIGFGERKIEVAVWR